MTTKTKRLTLKNLSELFNVSAPTIYAWQETRSLPILSECTPARVRQWATRNNQSMSCEPAALLGKDVIKPGPKPKPVEPERRTPGEKIRGNRRAVRRARKEWESGTKPRSV